MRYMLFSIKLLEVRCVFTLKTQLSLELAAFWRLGPHVAAAQVASL